MRFTIFISLILLSFTVLAQNKDRDGLKKYQQLNNSIIANDAKKNRVVFMGNSITEQWVKLRPSFFLDNEYIGRGISGQTTPQMLVRFRQDVVDLGANVVVILAGTNDIARNTGETTHKAILDNIKSMCDIAFANGIKVILCSVLPAKQYSWNKEVEPSVEIPQYNAILKDFAKENRIIYIDFFNELVDSNPNNKNGLRPNLTTDGVHLNEDGYAIMEGILSQYL